MERQYVGVPCLWWVQVPYLLLPRRSPWSQTSPRDQCRGFHTETTQTITETINSMDYSTGYQYSATGSGVTANGNLSPGTGSTNVTINGVTSQWTGATSKPQFTQTVPGEAFQFTETYSGPGLQNHTIIQRVTEVTSVTDTTSIFSQ